MRLSEPFEKSGYFWLPARPDNRLPGTLRVTETGKTNLDVIGIFGDALAALNDSTPDLGRIVGVTEDGGIVTLDRCFYRNRNIRLGGISKSTIHSDFLLCGVHYDESAPVTFSRFRFSVEGLDEWLSVSGLRVEHNWSEKSASIHFDPPKQIAVQLSDGIGLAFTFGWTLPGAPPVTEAKITQKAYITLTSDSPRPIADFLALVFRLNNFFCFATDQTVSLDSATGYSHEITRELVNGEKREVPISVYYESMPAAEGRQKRRWQESLFRYSDIANQIEPILNSWLSNYEDSAPAFNLYFASKSGAHRYLDGRFLSLAQGIETLHRRNSKETFLTEGEFDQLVETIVRGCPAERREWLLKKLEYANELPLRQRIRQMIEPFEILYGGPIERKHLIRKVIDTRNYLTHYDPKLAQRTASGDALWKLCRKLEALFQLHFLRLIGLDAEFIMKLANENLALRAKFEA